MFFINDSGWAIPTRPIFVMMTTWDQAHKLAYRLTRESRIKSEQDLNKFVDFKAISFYENMEQFEEVQQKAIERELKQQARYNAAKRALGY